MLRGNSNHSVSTAIPFHDPLPIASIKGIAIALTVVDLGHRLDNAAAQAFVTHCFYRCPHHGVVYVRRKGGFPLLDLFPLVIDIGKAHLPWGRVVIGVGGARWSGDPRFGRLSESGFNLSALGS